MKEYIICAAIHFDNGKTFVHQPKNVTSGFVVCGRRHHNCFATFSALMKYKWGEGTTDKDIDNYPKEIEQGFLTSQDRFVTRKEAAQLAFECEQIQKETTILFSEDLY